MALSSSIGTLSCGGCGAGTPITEPGWRAYRCNELDGRAGVLILCPSCSEHLYGEDEQRDNRPHLASGADCTSGVERKVG
jgi:hypothetical protein